jgi:Zn-dependent protease with chaperone function
MPYRTTSYRFPHETLVFWLTILSVMLVIAFTAAATVCMSGFFVMMIIVLSYYGTRSQHKMLLRHALKVSQLTLPDMITLIKESQKRLQVEGIDIFLASNRTLNAYTFGLSNPKAIILHDSLIKVMDRGEIQFILGHEMGHVALGHTWLNSLIGGMAGIPAPYSASYFLALIFRWWNRACEYSADRAGLLACNQPSKAISALVKLESSGRISSQDLERAYQKIQAEDDDPISSLVELTATHPMLIKRIEQLRKYSVSIEYQHTQTMMNQNLQI